MSYKRLEYSIGMPGLRKRRFKYVKYIQQSVITIDAPGTARQNVNVLSPNAS